MWAVGPGRIVLLRPDPPRNLEEHVMNRSRAARRALVATATGALLFGGGTSAAHADDVPPHVQGWSAELRSMTLLDDTGEGASDEVYITTSNLNGPDRIKMTRKREDFDRG